MVDLSSIKEHAEVIGADGAHVGTVDHVQEASDGNGRIKLTKKDSGAQIEGAKGAHEGHHHYIAQGLIAGIEDGGNTVRLSASGANAVFFEEEEGRQ